MLSKNGCVLLILTPVIKYLEPPTFRTDCILDTKFFIKPILILFSGSATTLRPRKDYVIFTQKCWKNEIAQAELRNPY
jgi:hypothetical protein